MAEPAAAAAQYRIASSSDLEVCVGLLCLLVDEIAYPPARKLYQDRVPDDIARALASPMARLVLAEVDGEVVGLGRGDVLADSPLFRLRDQTKCGYVDQLYVKPSHRGRGIAAQILQQLEAWFGGLGIVGVLLHASPLAGEFYAHRGYGPTREALKTLDGAPFAGGEGVPPLR